MMSSMYISTGVGLVALAAGTLLLAMARRDNLGIWYKIAGWFIILASIINMGCAALHCAMKFYGKQHMYKEWKMHGKMMQDGMPPMSCHGEGQKMGCSRDGYKNDCCGY